MKEKTQENFKSMDVKDLLKQKKDLVCQKIIEISTMATSGKRNSAKVKSLKRKIARIETEISVKLFNQTI